MKGRLVFPKKYFDWKVPQIPQAASEIPEQCVKSVQSSQ